VVGLKKNISVLMDGELCDEDAEILLRELKWDPAAYQEWESYHLIGDVLRQSDYLPRSISDTFFARLHEEPIIFAPQIKRKSKVDVMAISAIAAGVVVVLLTWLSLKVDLGSEYKGNRPPLANGPISSQFARAELNDYLVAHHEYSPATDVRGASSYIHNVANNQLVAAR
jgi:sigma-E factor negative regulatory protein RseA